MKATILGYPRIGEKRELKWAVEHYFKGQIDEDDLQAQAKKLRLRHWQYQRQAGLDMVPSNDFSFYDHVLDTAVLLDAIPARYRALGLSPLDTYFAMARGYQGPEGDVKALPMKKWFNTNYHYIVPEIGENPLRLVGSKPFDEYLEAQGCGIETRPVLVGPFTFLKLAAVERKPVASVVSELAIAYRNILARFAELGTTWVQFDEPALVLDMDAKERAILTQLYGEMLESKGVKVLLQTYFGDLRDCYQDVIALGVDAIGLDFVEGAQSVALVKAYGVPNDKTLVAGVVNGRNIWRNDYAKTLSLLAELRPYVENVVLSSSCSLLHVPYTVRNEGGLSIDVLQHLAFAEEKLRELADLVMLADIDRPERTITWQGNARLFASARVRPDEEVQSALKALEETDFERFPSFKMREKIQRESLKLPLFPTTTIGSFPQLDDVRATRAAYRKGRISEDEYRTFKSGENSSLY